MSTSGIQTRPNTSQIALQGVKPDQTLIGLRALQGFKPDQTRLTIECEIQGFKPN